MEEIAVAEKHFIHRSGWITAAVLGANDGILSTTSIAIGVAAASTGRDSLMLATLAGLVAGALSMAAGEYVSVSSQSDIEHADLEREKLELETMPETELLELAKVYESRGLSTMLALQVAKELTAHDALGAHARDELGINDMSSAKPLQAASASAIAFLGGGILPLLVSIFMPIEQMVFYQYGFAILFLAASGAFAAKVGGSNVTTSIVRICIWGTFAMVISAFVGYLFGTSLTGG